MITTLIVLALAAFMFLAFVSTPRFGSRPSGFRMHRVKQSPNFQAGQFQNLNTTPQLAEGVKYYTVFKDFFFSKSKRSKPAQPLTVTKRKSAEPRS
jgi:uncharacterized protein (DUF58 family)